MIDEDVSSIVSIVPFEIDEEKPGIYPGHFYISPSKNNIPEILEVEESIGFIEVDESRSVKVTNSSRKVAESIVLDYLNSQIAIPNGRTDEVGPGIFWKFGRYTLDRVYKECKTELEIAKLRQINWFTELVKMADDDWEKTRQHRSITDMQRYAAKYLKLERVWIVNIENKILETIKCPGCESLLSKTIVICPTCKCVLNQEAYKKLTFA